MKTAEVAKFLTGAALFSPFLAAEDILRYFGATISEHGITKNTEGKGILDIWSEVGAEIQAKKDEQEFLNALANLSSENSKKRAQYGW